MTHLEFKTQLVELRPRLSKIGQDTCKFEIEDIADEIQWHSVDKWLEDGAYELHKAIRYSRITTAIDIVDILVKYIDQFEANDENPALEADF